MFTAHDLVNLVFLGMIIAFWVGVIKLIYAAAKYLTKKANNSSGKNSDR